MFEQYSEFQRAGAWWQKDLSVISIGMTLEGDNCG